MSAANLSWFDLNDHTLYAADVGVGTVVGFCSNPPWAEVKDPTNPSYIRMAEPRYVYLVDVAVISDRPGWDGVRTAYAVSSKSIRQAGPEEIAGWQERTEANR